MRTIAASVLCLAAATLAQPAFAKADAYYCYWVDAPAKEAGVTAIFPGNRLKQKSVTGVFAADMQRQHPNKGRKYECPWKAEPDQAEENRAGFVAAHQDLGFRVRMLSWNPMSRQ